MILFLFTSSCSDVNDDSSSDITDAARDSDATAARDSDASAARDSDASAARDSDASAARDSQSDSNPDVSLDPSVEDPCNPRTQSWDLHEVRENFHEGTFQYTYSDIPLVFEDAFAKIENGEMQIKIYSPKHEKDEIGIQVFVYKKTGVIPGTHAFPPLSSDPQPEDETKAGYFFWDSPGVTGASVPANQGAVRIQTCPTEVGQFVIGEFIDAVFGHPVTALGTINGAFAIVVTESDGSMDCGAPQLCDY